MSQEHEDIVRRAVAMFNERGFDGFRDAEVIADAIEFHEPPEQPGPRVARGRDEVRRLAEQFNEAWEEHRSEPEEVRAVGPDKVLLLSVERFKGRDGIELEAPFAGVFTLAAVGPAE